jgi:hypothetical protein
MASRHALHYLHIHLVDIKASIGVCHTLVKGWLGRTGTCIGTRRRWSWRLVNISVVGSSWHIRRWRRDMRGVGGISGSGWWNRGIDYIA